MSQSVTGVGEETGDGEKLSCKDEGEFDNLERASSSKGG